MRSCFFTAALARLLALCLSTVACVEAVAVRDWEDEEKPEERSAGGDLARTKVRTLALVKDITPSTRASTGPLSPGRLMESDEGTVHWGRLLSRNEVCALVRVPVVFPPDPDVVPVEQPAGYLSLLAWSNGRWVYRQFLGKVDSVSLHEHRGRIYLLGAWSIGRFDGVHFSWKYDAGRRRLVETKWEHWGPFYLTGPYMVFTRGFERRAHWDTRWVHSSASGRKGPLVACLHRDDQGRFTITFRDARKGRLESWTFQPESEEATRYHVSPIKDAEDVGYDKQGTATVTVALPESDPESTAYSVRDDVPARCFQVLTGLNPHLLEDQWRDHLPKAPPLKSLKIEATGNATIVARFRQAHR